MTDRTAIEALIADVQNETVSSSSPHCDLPATLMLGAPMAAPAAEWLAKFQAETVAGVEGAKALQLRT